jgi:hypothetical protein
MTTPAQPVVCQRCGRPVIGTSSSFCGTCERAVERDDNVKHRRQRKAEFEHLRKVEGAWPRRGRR